MNSTNRQHSRAYFRALGKHVTLLRKEREMTQAELASVLGVSQQTVFAYELGDRRISVPMLAKLSAVFDIPVQDLMGLSKPAPLPKRRLSPRAARQAERLQALSKTERRFIVKIIDVFEDARKNQSAPR